MKMAGVLNGTMLASSCVENRMAKTALAHRWRTIAPLKRIADSHESTGRHFGCSAISTRFGQKTTEEQDETESLSVEYSEEMQEKMGESSLVYRHERGMNYARILDDVIVGSCPQTPADVDRLAKEEGVTTILCLQEDINLEYFGIDINEIQDRCAERGDIEHVRCPIRDFDPLDLRTRLPKVIAMLWQNHDPTNGTVYIHCTAGLGRAPAVALAYMFWCRGWTLEAANARLQRVRPCGPKLLSIRQATCDILCESPGSETSIVVKGKSPNFKVEVSGLDVGWGETLPLVYDKKDRAFKISRTLAPGRYQFKLVINGKWKCSSDYPIEDDGENTNNYIEVPYDAKDPRTLSTLRRLLSDTGSLTLDERWIVWAALKKLKPCSEECLSSFTIQ